MERSIFDNPKDPREPTLTSGLKNGLFTSRWKKRLNGLFKSLIPRYIPNHSQIWLDRPESLTTFVTELNDGTIDLKKIKYLVISEPIHDLYDIVDFFSILRDKMPDDGHVLFTGYNFIWAPIFRLGSLLRLSRNRAASRFYLEKDVDNFIEVAGWENTRRLRPFLLPVYIPVVSQILDRFLIRLPLFNLFSLNTIYISRKRIIEQEREHSVTVLIPCKNEEPNIRAIATRMPKFGARVEMLFINDKSTDKTEEEIMNLSPAYPEQSITLIQGKGRGKGQAVALGMKKATGDICMILDADLTVIPEDLPQFYKAMKWHYADFIHGTRLVYPQEKGAMRYFNLLGNIGFALLFSFILEQRTTDTLCGTKVFWRRDWPKFEEIKERLGHTDIWGDYNLIFGAAFYGLKISQLPVRYFERIEGETKMTRRLRNATIMFRVAWHALWKIKFSIH